MSKTFLILGAVFLALAVILGAFGSHVIKDKLTADRFDIYQTAQEFQFYHALGLVLIGILLLHYPDNAWITGCGWLLTGGIVIFSGSLYTLVLTNTSWLGAITPIGGVAFIAGWVSLIIGLWRG